MKKLFSLLLFFPLFAHAQVPDAHDYEEIEIKDSGVVFMRNGDTLTGIIDYVPSADSKIWFFKTAATRKGELFKAGKVNAFFLKSGRKYESVGEFNRKDEPSDTLFYQLMNYGNNAMKIYRRFDSGGTIVGGKLQGFFSIMYVIPGKTKPESIDDIKMKPFKEKMGDAVSDCSAPSDKIRNEEKGYKMGMMTTKDMKLEIMLRIANEYANCK
ncbi:MAG: hypothetical protein HY064_02480 [Bacteroidetes bacterium]|nr:hypothetical protein [Bacteroidota bacterium]